MSTQPGEDAAEKYTLLYYLPEDKDPESPPFKYRTYYLADALEGAWRNRQEGGSTLSIKRAESVILNEEELNEALNRVQALLAEKPERPLREIAERVLSDLGKA